MSDKSFEFKAFGIKDNLQSLVKRTGILEIVFGAYFLLVAALYFFVFISFLFYNDWGKAVFKIFGNNDVSHLGTFFIMMFIIMGALNLIIATLLLVSGLKAKSYGNNPVLLITGKKDYLAASIAYIGFMVLLLASIYLCIYFSFSLFVYFIMLSLLALLTITLYKFLALKNVPNKASVLDVENLPEDKKEAILLKSNTFSNLELEKEKKVGHQAKTQKEKNKKA